MNSDDLHLKIVLRIHAIKTSNILRSQLAMATFNDCSVKSSHLQTTAIVALNCDSDQPKRNAILWPPFCFYHI